jgi:hypothetical protein
VALLRLARVLHATFFDWRSASVWLLLPGVADCSTSDSIGARITHLKGGSGGSSANGGPGTSADGVQIGTGTGGSARLAPEMEVEGVRSAVATDLYVWSANPKTGRVAMIDSQTFRSETVAAGVAPTYIAAIPGVGDRAIVINVFSNDATYLSQDDKGQLGRGRTRWPSVPTPTRGASHPTGTGPSRGPTSRASQHTSVRRLSNDLDHRSDQPRSMKRVCIANRRVSAERRFIRRRPSARLCRYPKGIHIIDHEGGSVPSRDRFPPAEMGVTRAPWSMLDGRRCTRRRPLQT